MEQFANELSASAAELEASAPGVQWPGAGGSASAHNDGVAQQPLGDGLPIENRELIMDLPVTMKVVLGSATMPVAALSKLARGSVVKLDKKVGDPVDIVVNGRLVARGEVVVLDEATSRFGVTLTQVGGLSGSKK